MDMNIIKEYLVGIGFKINDESVKNAEQTISNVQDNIKKFADNNKENLSSTQKFIGTFSKYMKENLGIVSKILPEAKAPLLQIIGLTESLYKNIDKSNKGLKDIMTSGNKNSKQTQNFKKEIIKPESITSTKKSIKKEEIRSEYVSNIDTKESKKAVIDLINIIKELNSSINKLSKDINNISKVKVDTSDLKKSNLDIKDLNKESSNANKSLDKINNKNIKININELRKASSTINNFSKDLNNAQNPIKDLIDLSQQMGNINNKIASGINAKMNSDNFVKSVKNVRESLVGTSKESSNASKALIEFKEHGGKAIEDFSKGAKLSLGAIAIGVAAIATTITATIMLLTSLAKQDLGYQKLAMQLWTTKENAREIDMALKTMKVSMQDLWLSPELLQQFNQLRQDSAKLKLPSDFQDNLKIVRSVIFEFQRLKQEGVLVFQWIGYYISKYAAGPLAEFHQALKSFNDWVLKNIPNAGKIIGSTLGMAFRLILTLIQAGYDAIEPIIYFINLALEGLNKLSGPIKDIIELVVLLGIAMQLGPLGVITLILLALDDLYTALRGGNSLIGTIGKAIKESITRPIKEAKQGWDNFWQGVEEYIKSVEKKFTDFEAKIKNSALGKMIAKVLPDISQKAQDFSKNGQGTITSYVMPNTTNNRVSTSNNTTHQNNVTNNFKVYGSDNPNSTANVINSKINTSIKTRNLQGVT